MVDLAVRLLIADDIPACERILRDLPEWFGIETSVIEYVESLAALPGFVAIVDGEVAGFLALKEHYPDASEVHDGGPARFPQKGCRKSPLEGC